MNTTASTSIAIATLFDVAVWYYCKDLVIFDKKPVAGEELKSMGSEDGEKEKDVGEREDKK